MRPERRRGYVRVAAGALALLQGLALCACGQKGPLYLPDHTTTVVTHPAATAPQAAPPAGAPAPAGEPERKPDETDEPSPSAPPH